MSSHFLTSPLEADRKLTSLKRDAELRVLVPLYEAVIGRRLVLYHTSNQNKALPLSAFAKQRLPILTILVDTWFQSGPSGWVCAQAASEWCASAYAFSDPATAEFFQIVAEEAATAGRFVLVESSPEMVNAWRRLFGGRPVPLSVAST